MKKAQGISVNVIIIAAIALLVLVVLSVIYIGRMGTWGQKTADCDTNGGNCVDKGGTCATGYQKYAPWNCPKVGEQEKECCIQIET